MFFEASWNGFEKPFNHIIENTQRNQDILSKRGELANYEEIRMKWTQESKDRDLQMIMETQRLMLDMKDWLSKINPLTVLDKQLCITITQPSKSWFLAQPAWKTWLDPYSRIDVFYSHGIPGSGE